MPAWTMPVHVCAGTPRIVVIAFGRVGGVYRCVRRVVTSTLEEERRAGKVVNLVTDDPRNDVAKRKHKSVGSYSNFHVTKVCTRAATGLIANVASPGRGVSCGLASDV